VGSRVDLIFIAGCAKARRTEWVGQVWRQGARWHNSSRRRPTCWARRLFRLRNPHSRTFG